MVVSLPGSLCPQARATLERAQVLQDYCAYADAMVGRWHVKEGGHASPSVRALLRPLLNLFHGERNGKRWKTEIDRILQEDPAAGHCPSAVIARATALLDDAVLDGPPSGAAPLCALFAGEQTGQWPPEELPPSELVAACERREHAGTVM